MTVLWQEIVIRTLNMYMPGPAPGTPGNPGCYSTRPGHSWHQTKSCLHHHQGKTEDCEHQQQGSRHCSCHRSITISSIIPLQPKVTGAKTEEWVASALNYKLPHYSFISLSEINEFQFSIDVIDHNFCESSFSLVLTLINENFSTLAFYTIKPSLSRRKSWRSRKPQLLEISF